MPPVTARHWIGNVGTIQRRIDPNFATWKAARPGGAAAITVQDIRMFFQENVIREWTRAMTDTQGDDADDLLDAIRTAQATYNGALTTARADASAGNITALENALDGFITAINNGLATRDQAVVDDMHRVRGQQDIASATVATARNAQERQARRQRADIFVTLGTAHRNEVRGFRSVAEGNATIATIRNALANNGINDSQIAIRGSAVRGTNRDNTRAYRGGIAATDNANDASDIDFFFTSQRLEAAINAYDGPNGNSYEGGGNVHPDTLHDLLHNRRLNLHGVNQPALAAALAAFSTNTRTSLGRKADVTLVKQNTIATFTADEYILA